MGLATKFEAAVWLRLRERLDEALALPRAERAAWVDRLDEHSEGDLKSHLRHLLQTGGDELRTLPKIETAAFSPDVGAADGASEARPQGLADESPGAAIGPYRLLRELGAGGMASVWLAERDDMLQRRQVALKLPHGAWRRAGLAERLAREREILATLEHPNIARLYDAGVTAAGQPYLALEYIDGERIDEHCRRRALDRKSRLRLFLQAARAVAYAHGQLVVHRDLKPANMLVTQDGRVKLLDFGIAKLLEQGVAVETELTRQVGRALTPAYAAPEQLAGARVGAAADVFALGVVLHELLLGHRPGDAGDAGAVLRGDLATVLAKALKADPLERYATAAAFADDIERHLNHQPVLAQPDSARYRLAKFVRRNRASVAAVGAVGAALLAGALLAAWQAQSARAERDLAQQQQRRAEAYSSFMRMLVQDAVRAGQPLSPRELVERGMSMLERQTAGDPALAAHIGYELSRFHLMFAQRDRELAALARSSALAAEVGDHNLSAAAECSAAWTLLAAGRSGGEARLQRGLRALAAAAPQADAATSDCLRAEARWLQSEGRAAEAIERIRGSELWQRRLEAPARWRVDPLRVELFTLYRAVGRHADALALTEEALQVVRASGRQGSVAELVALANHASNLARLGEYVASGEVYREALAWVERSDNADLAPSGLRQGVALALLRTGDDAQRAWRLADTDRRSAQVAGDRTGAAAARAVMARAEIALGRFDDAARSLDEAQAAFTADPVASRAFIAAAASERARLLLLRGRIDAARHSLQQPLAAAGYPGPEPAPDGERLLLQAARIELAASAPARALPMAEAALRLARRSARADHTSGDVGQASLLRAETLLRLARREDAAIELRRALAALRQGYGPQHADTRRAAALAAELGLQP